MGMKVDDLSIEFNDGVALIRGSATNQEEREKVVLLVGNTKGVSQVNDQMTVQMQTAEAVLYTVESGDTLSKIAREQYGSAGKYMAIFDANKPMLKDPNKIYPGQVLRIPPMKG
jgi:nucleoid-associated protein YgaU